MVCKYCGGEILQGQRYCPYCGREADPREKVVEVRHVYVQPPRPNPTQLQLEKEVQNSALRGMLAALISLVVMCVRPVFLILAFVFYLKTDKMIRERRIPAPPMHRTTRVLMIISLVFTVAEIVMFFAVMLPSSNVSIHTGF